MFFSRRGINRLGIALLFFGTVTGLTVAAEPAGQPLKVHLISAADEYKSEPSLKALSRYLTENYHVTTTASWGRDGVTELDHLDQLQEAELLVIFARRMKLTDAQMKTVRSHWQAGKPVVGIRTASHAFSREENETFDKQVLGGNYQGHYGNEPVKIENVVAAADHPVLAGVGAFTSAKLYKVGPLPQGTTVLQNGDIGKASHPVTIVHEYEGGRMFYTSAGVPSDFENENFRRLLVNAVFWTSHRDPGKIAKGTK